MSLIDGSAKTGWSSPQGKPFPHTMVIELPQRYRLSSIALDNSQAQEPGYPGISARAVEVWTSTTSAEAGFSKVATLEAAKGASKEFALPTPTEAQWLKLVITSNYGHKEYSELMEVEAYGTPVGPPPKRPPRAGVYDTNYGKLQLWEEGDSIVGCYPSDGTVMGSADGRTITAEWRQNQGKRFGGAVFVLNSPGVMLNGLWYENGQLQGQWFGKRAASSGNVCARPGNQLSYGMSKTGRVILYGIHFDSDSPGLRPDSEPALKEVVTLLNSQPALKIKVEGHTDSTNSDGYNLDLSNRRAQAVVSWLVAHGIAADRLTAEGLGKTRPLADNSTAQGRALNRRVEIVAQ